MPRTATSRVVIAFHWIEGALLVAAFFVSMILPLVDAIGRPFGGAGVPGSASYRAQLTLWLAFRIGLVPAAGHAIFLPLLALILLAALVGAPVFVAMGGVALVLFFKDAVPVSSVTAEIYRLMVSPTLPAIPLLTACGYVLAESHASTRLVRFFRSLFG